MVLPVTDYGTDNFDLRSQQLSLSSTQVVVAVAVAKRIMTTWMMEKLLPRVEAWTVMLVMLDYSDHCTVKWVQLSPQHIQHAFAKL